MRRIHGMSVPLIWKQNNKAACEKSLKQHLATTQLTQYICTSFDWLIRLEKWKCWVKDPFFEVLRTITNCKRDIDRIAVSRRPENPNFYLWSQMSVWSLILSLQTLPIWSNCCGGTSTRWKIPYTRLPWPIFIFTVPKAISRAFWPLIWYNHYIKCVVGQGRRRCCFELPMSRWIIIYWNFC